MFYTLFIYICGDWASENIVWASTNLYLACLALKEWDASVNLHLEPFSSVLVSGLMGDLNGGHMSLENLKSAGHTWFKSGSRCYHSNQRPGLMALRVDFTLFTCLRQNQEKKDATLNTVPPFALTACTIHLLYLCSVLSLYLRRYTLLPCPRCSASAAEVTELA